MSDVASQRLLKLLEVEREARQALTKEAFGYHVVTRTREVFPYMQGALIAINEAQKPVLQAVSDVAAPDLHGPFSIWLREVATHLIKSGKANKLHQIDVSNLPDDLKVQWANWAPKNVIWAPLLTANQKLVGGFWLTREDDWLENEVVLIERLSDCYAHGWHALNRRPGLLKKVNKKVVAGAVAVVLMLGLIPIEQSTLAPGEIIPTDPIVISAPLDGVVASLAVQPHDTVTAGQELIRFDETVLQNKVEIAKEAMAVTKAELQTTRQSAFHDLESQSKIALLEAQVGLRQAELSYAESLLKRSVVYAERDGVVVFRDVNDWVGRPTQTGERIMLLADPNATQLKIELPVSDAISLDVGSEVRLFLDVDPLSSISAKLVRTSYETQLSQNGQNLNFQVIADFDETETPPRIGLRGTAKLYGDHTVLGLYIFRKPLASMRKWIGW
ncbi:HlyD family efflux transporter periplasmic adaptor subunit [Terasakiella sp. A23]|uniref:efflux RND transporter periplasmic adaptor subunit n=1 Tax=Terasakiella sp. FCG-A23 TaxID=3080561 RepID=UPI0029545184|nr:HlyD family efflux transporter periplasmic adaptor subunit [Terasakiella sp. A23]MDV7340343.1 HlyD family efflux transporter periplasmic adaptor subunit [Terasakiella sp. A23]